MVSDHAASLPGWDERDLLEPFRPASREDMLVSSL